MGATAAIHPTDDTLRSHMLGTLDTASAESVNKHLEGCSACQRRLAEMSPDGIPGAPSGVHGQPDSTGPCVSSSLDGLSMLDDGESVKTPPPNDTLPPGLVDHPDYEVIRELGHGGMGTVYLAKNRLMGRLEVLKVVSKDRINRPGSLDRFLIEIRNAACLHHTNIVTAYSAMRIGESIVFAMEYVDGLDLSKLVKAKGPLPVANACNYVHQTALGLQHASEMGMVHRDIKPGNLMLTRQANRAVIKVLDFGLAKVKSEAAVDGGLTCEGQLLGTPEYVSPEQISDARRADIRADIYSLGCTLYYLLTAAPPFHAKSLYEILQAHHSMDAFPLNLARPEIPVELAALVARMMAKEPARRFQTPKDVAQSLLPFFKRGMLEIARPSAEVSQPGVAADEPASTRALSIVAESVAQAPPFSVLPVPEMPPAAPCVEPSWESLIKFKQAEPSAAPAQAISGSARPPRRVWPAVAVAGLPLALFIASAVVFRTATSNETVEQVALSRNVGAQGEPNAAFGVQAKGGVRAGVIEPPATGPVVKGDMPRTNGPSHPKGAASGTTDFDRDQTNRPGLIANSTPTRASHSAESLFNGLTLTGWEFDKSDARMWRAEDQTLVAINPDGRGQGAKGRGRLLTKRSFKEFIFRFEFQASPDFDFAAVWWTLPGEVPPSYRPARSIFGGSTNRGHRRRSSTGKRSVLKGRDEWNVVEIEARDWLIRISVNGKQTIRKVLPEKPAQPAALMKKQPEGPFPRAGIDRRHGRVGFEVDSGGTGRFRNIEIEELPPSAAFERPPSNPAMQVEEDLFDEDSAQESAPPEKPRPIVLATPPRQIRNLIGMTFQLIPAGQFMMGAHALDPDAAADEKPPHEVRVGSFYLGVTEVTQAQYEAVMRRNPSHFSATGDGKEKVAARPTGQYPVERVRWLDAVRFCEALNETQRPILLHAARGKNHHASDKPLRYRLPTEAEWEYACKAGTVMEPAFRKSSAKEFAWFKADATHTTHPVGEKRPNALGLYDMHGNVAEWCSDWYDEAYYRQSPTNDPQGPDVGGRRVFRGGSWRSQYHDVRSSKRFNELPAHARIGVGFRVALAPPGR